MWIVLCNSFLMKACVKKEVCGSREQCMEPIGTAEISFSQKKKRKKKKENADIGNAWNVVFKRCFYI